MEGETQGLRQFAAVGLNDHRLAYAAGAVEPHGGLICFTVCQPAVHFGYFYFRDIHGVAFLLGVEVRLKIA